jgi:CheY-like chemotaxis protein
MVPTDTMLGRVAGPEPSCTERDGAADAVATSSLWGQGPIERSNTPAGRRGWWPFATIAAMTDSPGGPGSAPTLSTDPVPAGHRSGHSGATPVSSIRVLLFSDDSATRDAVRLAVGRRPARDVELASWFECATPAAVVAAVEGGGFDVLVLDGESSPIGGLGLAKQLKNEIFDCPPILVLTGRPQDGWLAAWSQADLAVSHPLDPIAVARAVAELGRRAGSAA